MAIPRHLLPDGVFHIVGNVVSLMHCECPFDDNMQINVVAKSDLSDMALLKPNYSRNGGSDGANLLF